MGKNDTAFANICPSTGKTCTAADIEVTNALCEPSGSGPHKIPDTDLDFQCMWSGPALDYPRPASADHLRDMVNARVTRQNGTDSMGRPLIEQWNEVVLDERLLVPAMEEDP